MLGRWLARPVLGRVAIGGLALGLTALAGLVLWATLQTRATAAKVTAFNDISARWNTIFVRLSAEDVALREFITTNGGELQKAPLTATMGSAEPNLAWLERHGGPVEADHVRTLRLQYKKYSDVVQAVLRTAPDSGSLANYGELASLDLNQVRDQVVANVERKQRELARYLAEVEQRNASLRLITIAVVVVDLSFCAMGTAILVVNQRMTERAVATSRHRALHDPLTGLANRHLLAERTVAAVRQAHQSQGAVGLLLIDLDRFKRVNDTLGHPCGDALLRQVADRMMALSRQGDLVARLGGDEFAVLLASIAAPEDVTSIAWRLHAAIEEPVELEGHWVEVGASIGAAIYPLDCGDSEELLRHADTAMYLAKRGHLGVTRYSCDLAVGNPTTLTAVDELRHGMERGELCVHYQPRIDTRTMRAVGVEALARWQDGGRELLLPEAFLPLIEANDVVEQLTEQVLRAAVGQAHEWLAAGWFMPVSVNIAARSLLNPAFPARVAAVLEAFGVPPRLLTIEVNEAVLLTEPQAAAKVLRQIRQQGVRAAVDGFGVGHSSMTLLRDVPVDEVKLDRRLIANLPGSDRDRAVVRAVVTLAGDLLLDVVAVGVADDATATVLTELGCHGVQGYHICRPLSSADVTAWLRQHSPTTPTGVITR